MFSYSNEDIGCVRAAERFAQSSVRLDVNKLVGCILWERCAASRWYLFATGGCLRPGCRLLRPQWHPGKRSHIFAVRIEVCSNWYFSVYRRGKSTGGGVRGGGSVHSPLTRARSDRRSRSVRRLKVGRHVTWRVPTPAPRDVLQSPRPFYYTVIHKHFKLHHLTLYYIIL